MLFCMLLKLNKKWFSTIERIANHTNVRYASYNISIIMMIVLVLGERQKLGDFLGGRGSPSITAHFLLIN